MAMTLEQAADLLGVSSHASKDEISAAYRKKVAQYHPDANRGKSQEEQVRAEKMFKAVTQAKKIMLNPSMAAPEPVIVEDQTIRPNPSTQSTGARARTQTQSASAGTSSGTTRPKYNESKAFMGDNVPHIVDQAEYELHGIYADDAKDAYAKASDNVRLTPSIMISIAFLVWGIASVLTDANGIAEALTPTNPFILLAAVSLFKILVYDLFISYYVYRLVSKARFTWSFVLGLDTLVMGAVTFVLLQAFGGFAPLGLIPMVLGIIFLIVGISMKKGSPT